MMDLPVVFAASTLALVVAVGLTIWAFDDGGDIDLLDVAVVGVVMLIVGPLMILWALA